MKRIYLVLLVSLLSSLPAFSQTDGPFTPDSLTRALWHFDDTTGSVIRDAAGRNNGVAYGTSIAIGRFGLARSFNGTSDYVWVPPDSSLDFGDSSFSISVWFRTITDSGFLVRRGLGPLPGYQISITHGGKLACQIGNRGDSHWPDTLLTIITTTNYNDGTWHLATMVRDRASQRLSLFADGVLAAPPIDDHLTFPLNSDRPLTIGRWESASNPVFFAGVIDEIKMSGPAFKSGTQTFTPFPLDSLTRSLWHLDDSTGAAVRDAAGKNNGIAFGTSIVPGRFGRARSFNGVSDYVYVSSDSSLDFGSSSFTIDVWFKTTTAYGMLVRRGMAPLPGYNISIYQGRIGCQVGNRTDSSWPDTVLTIISPLTYNDGAWHLATMVRDRGAKTLSLYADGILVSPPIGDNITFPINCDRPLTLGRWESDAFPDFFAGAIDEVRLSGSRVFRPAVGILVQPASLNFGKNRIQFRDTLSLEIDNTGYRDSLHVGPITTTNPRFSVSKNTLTIPGNGAFTLRVFYTPTAAQTDTGSILIASDDPASPLVRIGASGEGFGIQKQPLITGIKLIPNSSVQARISWLKSIDDSAGAADQVTQYSIWRRVPPGEAAGQVVAPATARPGLPTSVNTTWDFIQAVPAIALDSYAAIVPIPYVYPYPPGLSWYVFIVVAQSKGMQVYTSAPDSIRVTSVTDIGRAPAGGIPTEVTLKQNFPNPFNPSTLIRYGLPARGDVSLIVYNALGQTVATLVDQTEEAGFHEARFDAAGLASGVYFCRLRASTIVRTTKILLVR
jgi:hypothetical protein